MQSSNATTGRSAFLSVLKDEGVTHLFGNPGTTELPIMHALGEHPDLTYVLAMQESLVVAMADGFARASGRLAACNVHVAPGLGNAIGAIYTANNSRTPMIVTAGQQEQGHGLTEPLLYAPLVPIAAPVVKWATEITRLEDLPRTLRRAAKVAMTHPMGPVFISLPGDVLNAEAAVELGNRTRVDTAVRPSDAALGALADRLKTSKRPAIIAGHEVVTSDAFAEAAQLAEAMGAAVYQQTVPHGAHFPSEHPNYVGPLTRSQREVRDTLAPYDLLLCLGADVLRMSIFSPVDPLPPGLAVVQIGQDDWEMGKNYPAEIAIRADLKQTIRALLPRLGQSRGQPAGIVNWSAQRSVLAAELESKGSARPIDPDWLMLRLANLLPKDAVVVDEGIVSSRRLLHLMPYRDRLGYFGNVSGGIGWALPAAVGVSLALPDRRVVAVIGDGSSMYSIQALWTAAHKKLPITYVIANNGGYRILKERLKAFHGNDQPIGMDFRDPPVDVSAIARGLGMQAERVVEPAAFDAAFKKSITSSGPMLIEAVVSDR